MKFNEEFDGLNELLLFRPRPPWTFTRFLAVFLEHAARRMRSVPR